MPDFGRWYDAAVRLSYDAPALEPVESLLKTDFLSKLPSDETLRQAWADPRLSPLTEQGELGRALTRNGVRCGRIVQGFTGVVTGIPMDALGPFGEVISRVTSDQAIGSWEGIALGTTRATMDLALEGMGAIPFVGWVAKFALGVLEGFITRRRKQKPLPPMARYKREADEDAARAAVDVIRTGDWTPLFLPLSGERGMSWRLYKKTGGYNVSPWREEIKNPFSGLLGGFTGMGTVDVPFIVDPEIPKQHDDDAAAALRMRRDWMEDSVINTYDLTPSVARLVQSAWVAATASTTPALFNIDTGPVVRGWKNFVEGALESAEEGIAKTKDPRGEAKTNRRNAWYALRWAVTMNGRGFGNVSPAMTLYDECLRRGRDLYKRQLQALDTLQVAYCSSKQAAFRDNVLRDKLKERRGQLLTHAARWKVNPRDVVDDAYRRQLQSAGAGTLPIAARTLPEGPFGGSINPAVPMPDLGERLRPSRTLLYGVVGGTALYGLARYLRWI